MILFIKKLADRGFQNKKKLSNQGFTLIEVVLVLAIAGLIFLLAFLAFKQVGANRRDTQRRTTASQVFAEIQNASGDGMKITNQTDLTGGTVTSTSGFVGKYLKAPVKGPSGVYTFKYQDAPASGSAIQSTLLDQVQVTHDAECGNSAGELTRVDGAYAVMLKLEKGTVCRDDQ